MRASSYAERRRNRTSPLTSGRTTRVLTSRRRVYRRTRRRRWLVECNGASILETADRLRVAERHTEESQLRGAEEGKPSGVRQYSRRRLALAGQQRVVEDLVPGLASHTPAHVNRVDPVPGRRGLHQPGPMLMAQSAQPFVQLPCAIQQRAPGRCPPSRKKDLPDEMIADRRYFLKSGERQQADDD